jgi:hypothetical protein
MPEAQTASAAEALAKLPHARNSPAGSDDAPPEPNDPAQADDGAGIGAETPTDDETQKPEATDSRSDVQAPIAAPASWRADAKHAFAKLPPDLQRVVLERESQREAEFTRRQQEFAEFQRSRDTHLAQAQQYAEHLAQLVQSLSQEMAGSEFADIRNANDLAQLAEKEPSRFLKWQARQLQLQQAQQALEHEQSRQRQVFQQQQAQWQQDQEAKLVAAIPEWKDAAKGQREIAEIRDYLVETGALHPQNDTPLPAEAWLIGRKAMLFDRAQKARVTQKVQNLPQVIRPGSGPAKDEGRVARIAAAEKQFRKTGDHRDAARLLAARRGAS